MRLLLALLLALGGCVAKPVAPAVKPTPRPGIRQDAVQVATLTGSVRLISDTGGSIISNNSGAIISNNSGAYRVQATAEAQLADAVVTVQDAGGTPLLDAAGKPISATTDRNGVYKLTAALPRQSFVLRVKLWSGGQLAAIAAGDRAGDAPVDLDTASSIGASYVLGEFVKGDQQVFNKLPAREAERLKQGLDGARNLITRVPRYDEAELVALGQELRGKDAGVNQVLEDIRALLIGQANLGAGRLATDVPLLAPRGLAVGADGSVYVGEPAFGRLRAIDPKGMVSTLADVTRGKVRRNFKDVLDLAAAPDGSLYVLTAGEFRVYRLWPDGKVDVVFGGSGGTTVPGGPAVEMSFAASCIAVGDDGTLYVAGGSWDGGAPGIIAVGADGKTREFARGELVGGAISVITTRGGELYYFEERGPDKEYTVRMVRRDQDGKQTLLSQDGQRLGVTTDGRVFYCHPWSNQIMQVMPDGKSRVVAGPGGLAGSEGLDHPIALASGPDGTLYVLATGNALVHALSPDGKRWRTVAGTTTFDVKDGQPGDIPLNGPAGLAFDRQGRLIVSETGTSTLKRLDGSAFTRLAGGIPWSTAVGVFSAEGAEPGEGLPALETSFERPRGLAAAGDGIYIVDHGNQRIRLLDAAGNVRTVVGPHGRAFYQDSTYAVDHPFHPRAGLTKQLVAGEALDAKNVLTSGNHVTAGPDGSLYFTTGSEQVARLRPDGKVVLVAGKHRSLATNVAKETEPYLDVVPGSAAPERSLNVPSGLAIGPDGALYVAETLGLRIFKVLDPAGDAPTLAPVAGMSLSGLLALSEDATPDGEGVKPAEALVSAPLALCFSPAGELFFSELGASSAASLTAIFPAGLPMPEGVRPTYPRVRKLGKDGLVRTVAGPGSRFFSDPKAEDALVLPAALSIDPQGRLVIVDAGANLIRILPAGSY